MNFRFRFSPFGRYKLAKSDDTEEDALNLKRKFMGYFQVIHTHDPVAPVEEVEHESDDVHRQRHQDPQRVLERLQERG